MTAVGRLPRRGRVQPDRHRVFALAQRQPIAIGAILKANNVLFPRALVLAGIAASFETGEAMT
jgi:hypothetical protein